MITISEKQRTMLERIASARHLDFIVAYGSRVSGHAREDSDLDVAVLSRREPDYELFKNLFSSISDVFVGANVDLRFLNGADPLFTMQVVRDGVLFVGDRERYDDFRALANRRFIDDGMTYFPAQKLLLHVRQHQLEGLV